MQSDQPGYTLTLVDPKFFESLSRYRPRPEYRDPVKEMLGPGWEVIPTGFWTQANPDGAVYRQQGWKIHVSSVPSNARETLRRVVPLLAAGRVPFKFVSDSPMHDLSLKNWPREGAGKFMTIYPPSDEEFRELVVRLHELTRDLRGPYILSDRPYLDSRTIYYRYGEHLGATEVTPRGTLRRVLHSPQGLSEEDTRTPYYQLPSWVSDPYGRPPVDNVVTSRKQVVLAGRYRVVDALKFNSSGGIYAAVDERTDRKVVIREARPHLAEWAPGQDAITMLQKEARILERMGPHGVSAGFVEIFQQWEHWFLVQDRIEAESLWGHAVGFYWGRHRRRTPRDTFRRIRETFLAVMAGMETFHENGIVLRDMTRSNVLIRRADTRPFFIDFEMAYEMDRDDPPVHGFTPGFASADQLAHKKPTPAEDHYALGALLLDTVCFMVSGITLNRAGILEAFHNIRRDLELPKALEDVVHGLLEEETAKRWDPARVRAALERVRPRDVPARRGHSSPAAGAANRPHSLIPRPPPSAALRGELEGTVPELVRFIQNTATLERTDRLWPASPDVFYTNPVSVQFGAAGILGFLHRATGQADPAQVEWMVNRLRDRVVPPGLQVGRAGAAMVLAELGRADEAYEVAAGLAADPLLQTATDYWTGSAGVGIALLALARRLDRPELERDARLLGDRLLAGARTNRRGLFWHDGRTRVPLGMGHGGAGIGLFFAYLAKVTGEERYLDAGRRALDFDLSHVVRAAGEVLWFPATHAGKGEPKSPHIQYGSAGVGCAALRMYQVTGDDHYLSWAWECARAVCERLTNKPWYNYGIAGFGNYLLDMHRVTGDDNCLNTAFYLAEALLPHRIAEGRGTAFAGSELVRLSCDFGMGTAGIGWFMLRLLNPELMHPFFPDELLAPEVAARPAARARRPRRVLVTAS